MVRARLDDLEMTFEGGGFTIPKAPELEASFNERASSIRLSGYHPNMEVAIIEAMIGPLGGEIIEYKRDLGYKPEPADTVF
jgi:hypothetical protein